MKNNDKYDKENLSHLSEELLSKRSDKKKKKRKREKDEMDEDNLYDNSMMQENGTDQQDLDLSFSEEPLSKRKSKKRRKADKESNKNLNYNSTVQENGTDQQDLDLSFSEEPLSKRKSKKRRKTDKENDGNLNYINNNNEDESSILESLIPKNIDIINEKNKEKKYKEEIKNEENKNKGKKRKKEESEDSEESIDESSYKKISWCNMSVHELKERAEAKEVEKIDKNSKLNRKLLKIALSHVEPNSKVYILTALKNLDYKQIADEIDEDLTPESCQQLLRKLIFGKAQTKCLYQVLRETKVALLSNSIYIKKRARTSFSSFYAVNSKKMDGIKSNVGQKKLKMAAEMWRELTDLEQKKWSYPNCRGKTPFDVFVESKRKENKSVKVSELRQVWPELPIEEKAKFIEQSATIMMNIEEEEKEKETPICKKDIIGPSKEEILPYLTFVGLPENPSKSHQVYYLKKSGIIHSEDFKNILIEARKHFSELDLEEQHLWISKHHMALSIFNEKYQQWIAESHPASVYLYNLYESIVERKKGKKSSSQISKKKKKNIEFNKIVMPIWRANFDGEPAVPPLNPEEIYVHKVLKRTKKSIALKKAKRRISELSLKDQHHLEAKALKIRSIFIDKVLEYAKSMEKVKLKLFLGMRRIFYFKLLDQDIFQKEFPDSKYPVYVKPNNKKTSVNKKTIEQQEKSDLMLNKLLNKEIKKQKTTKKTSDEKTSAKKTVKTAKSKKTSVSENITMPDKSTVPAKKTKPAKTSNEVEFPCLETTSKEDESKARNSKKSSSKNYKSEEFVKMDSDSYSDSDSDSENAYGDSIQAYMNFLTFSKDKIESEESDGD